MVDQVVGEVIDQVAAISAMNQAFPDQGDAAPEQMIQPEVITPCIIFNLVNEIILFTLMLVIFVPIFFFLV